jgi:hypothetical protein
MPRRLQPQVHLPFRDKTFDLVLDRHSSYWPSEVRRVLTDGGVFLTQQRSLDATKLFCLEPSDAPVFDLTFAVAQLKANGFGIRSAEEVSTPMAFFDIGALLYYLRAVPWVVPNFEPRAQRGLLCRLNDRILAEGAVHIPGTQMLIVAVRSSD